MILGIPEVYLDELPTISEYFHSAAADKDTARDTEERSHSVLKVAGECVITLNQVWIPLTLYRFLRVVSLRGQTSDAKR